MPPPFQIVSRTLGSEHDAGRWGTIERISRTVLCLEFLVQLFRLILDVPLEEFFMFFYEISVHAGCVNTCMWQVVDGGWAQSGATSFLHFAGINASIATCMDMFFYVELLQMRIETAGFDSSKVQCQWFLAQLKRFGT